MRVGRVAAADPCPLPGPRPPTEILAPGRGREELYPRDELVGMFRQSEQLLAELQGGALELETLEPDGNGNFRIATGYADNIAGPDPGDDDRASEPEDRRQVVFINSRGLFSAGR